MTQQALHTCIGGVSAILLCKSSQAQSYWMGTTSGQPFSGLSRNVRQGSSQGSGWATLGHSQSCPKATPVLPWLCLGSLSCWKVNLLPSLRFRMLWTRFSLRHPQYFGTLRFSSTLRSTSVPTAKKKSHSMRLLSAHFTFEIIYSAGDDQSWFPSNMMLRIEVHQTR